MRSGRLGGVLKALACQTFQDFEIILVDDNSTDKTLAIAKKFTQKLPIQIIKLKPGEFSHPYSLNLGASRAKGKYLCLLSGGKEFVAKSTSASDRGSLLLD